MNRAKSLAKELRNIGPKLAEKMIEVGIDSPKKLRTMGAIRSFEAMYPDGDSYGDFNAAYLYALEGAIRDCDSANLPEKTKTNLKEYAQKRQNTKR